MIRTGLSQNTAYMQDMEAAYAAEMPILYIAAVLRQPCFLSDDLNYHMVIGIRIHTT